MGSYRLPLRVIFSVLLLDFRHVSCFSATPADGNPNKSKWKAVDEVLPPEYYRRVYDDSDSERRDPIPWDVGGPQPTVRDEARAGTFAGKSVLDCGCGSGENAALLAGKLGRARSVTGFDISAAAVARARDANAGADAAVEFRVASCADLGASFPRGETFEVAVDSACLHCLSDADATAYAESLRDVVTERLFVGCFSKANAGEGWSNPRRLGRDDLERYFPDEHWEMVRIDDVWWSRPGARGSSQGAFCPGLWMEAVRRNRDDDSAPSKIDG